MGSHDLDYTARKSVEQRSFLATTFGHCEWITSLITKSKVIKITVPIDMVRNVNAEATQTTAVL